MVAAGDRVDAEEAGWTPGAGTLAAATAVLLIGGVGGLRLWGRSRR
jgi:hypothetical protein